MSEVDQPLRIWIVNHYAMPPASGGGTRHYDLSRILVSHGHRVVIFASSLGRRGPGETPLSGARITSRSVVGGVVFRWIRTPRYEGSGVGRIINMLAFAALLPLVQALHRRPDVVVGSTVHPIAALSALAVARIRGARFVFEVRDLWPETLIDMGAMRRGSPPARALGLVERTLCRSADHIICLMPGAVDYLKRLAAPGVPVTNIPNGVDLGAPEEPPPTEAADAVSLARRRARFIVAWVGSMSPVNGLDTVVDAAAIVERARPGLVHFLLVGDGPLRPALQASAHDRGLENVSFVSRIPKASVRPFLRSVDGAILHWLPLPVLRFGISPNKIFDYFAAARPVVFACTASNDPVAEAMAGISIRPCDPDVFADAVIRLAEMAPEERRAMGLRGLEYVREKHDIAMLGARLMSVVEDLPARRTAGDARKRDGRSRR